MSTLLLLRILATAVGGLFAFIFMLVNPAGPGLVLVAVSPFDALFTSMFGIAGNLVTYIPILGMVLRSSGEQLVRTFIGTRIQVAFAILIVLLAVSHLSLVASFGMAGVFEYLRKITTLMLVGVFARYMLTANSLVLMNKTLVVSMAIYMTLSLLNFYLDLGLLPGVIGTQGGALGLSVEDAGGVHGLRFYSSGLQVNRTANWLLMPIFIALGWYLSPERSRRGVPLLCGAVLVMALAATISRSGLLGLVVGIVILLPSIARLNASQVLLGLVGGVFAFAAAYLLMDQVGFIDAFESRFISQDQGGTENETGRSAVFLAAMRVFFTSPIIGVGDSMTALHSAGIGKGAHNSILGLLAEAGVVGTIPYLVLLGLVIYRLSRPLRSGANPVYVFWRPFFLAGYLACLTQSMFNEYTWERLTWYGVAFAVAIELGAPYTRAKREDAAEPLAPEVDGLTEPGPDSTDGFSLQPRSGPHGR